MRKTAVPHFGQTPLTAGRLFFSVTFLAFWISTFSLHFTQYACAILPASFLFRFVLRLARRTLFVNREGTDWSSTWPDWGVNRLWLVSLSRLQATTRVCAIGEMTHKTNIMTGTKMGAGHYGPSLKPCEPRRAFRR